MNKIVDLYLSRKDVPTRFDVVQGAQSPSITFVLKDYEPVTGATARIFIKKKESEVYNTCELSENEVTFNPTVTSFDEPGECKAQLEIVSDGKIAVSYLLYADVEPNIIDSEAIEASDDFSALQDAILAVGDISEYKAQTTQNTSDIAGIKPKTDKIIYAKGIEDINFGTLNKTRSTYLWGNTINKVGIGAYNNEDEKRYNLLATSTYIRLQNHTDDATEWIIYPANINKLAVQNNVQEMAFNFSASGNPYIRWKVNDIYYQFLVHDGGALYEKYDGSSWANVWRMPSYTYQAGESITFTKFQNIFAGHVTNATKQIAFTIPLPRQTTGRTCTLTLPNDGLTVRAGTGGYVDGGDINVNASDYTLYCVPCAIGVYVYVNKTTVYTNVTNNTACSIQMQGTLTFS